MTPRIGTVIGILSALAVLTLLASAHPEAGARSAGPVPGRPSGSGDWPQWRGPDRTGVARETGLLKSWPPDGPRLVWKAQGLGGGHSTPSFSHGRIFGMSWRGQDEVVWALAAVSGRPLWTTRIAPANFSIGSQAHAGSNSTPTVDGNRSYSLGESGDLVCLQVADGKLL